MPAALAADTAVLADNGAGTWLLWNGRRSLIDLDDRAVTSALGLGAEMPAARPISPGLFNAVPEGPPLRAPVIPGAGAPPQFPLPIAAPVGAVVVSYGADDAMLLLRGLARRPAADLAGAGGGAAQHQLLRPGAAAATRVPTRSPGMPVSRVLDTGAYPGQADHVARRRRVLRSPVFAGRNPLTPAQVR